MRLMTYNILMDAQNGQQDIAAIINHHQPDIVFLQEIIHRSTVDGLAEQTGMQAFAAYNPRWWMKVSALTRLEVLDVESVPLWAMFGAALKVTARTQKGNIVTVYGVHLVAYYTWYAELIRGWQIKNLLKHSHLHGGEYHALVGDFNTFAPGDEVDLAAAPGWVRRQTWPQFGLQARWALNPLYEQAHYTDTFRQQHPTQPGRTLPAPDPHVRLDYIFANIALSKRLQNCDVVQTPDAVRHASDHLPVLATFDI
jgi:endonuclease/exonuclease/phosphatase family metal-dependent hydrolase